jgi:antitoxin MazE
MNAKIQKWGNSLAVRIPIGIARQINLDDGASVDISINKQTIIMKPLHGKKFTLDELLHGITKKNIHDEADSGPSVGREFS